MSVSEFPGRAVGTPIEPPSALPEGSCMPQLDIVGLSRICFCPRIKGWINQTLLSPLPSVFARCGLHPPSVPYRLRLQLALFEEVLCCGVPRLQLGPRDNHDLCQSIHRT
jgi:hypothetical protein